MSVRAARQLFLVGLALALWSALGGPGWLELLGCYLAALCLTDLAVGLQLLPNLPARSWLVLAVLLALPGLRFAYNTRERIAEAAGLVGLGERLHDRARLARSPAIAPGLVSSAEPQTFFIEAGQAREASVVFGTDLRLNARALGPGLFRVDYDPRRDGLPKVLDGELPISIRTDADVASRTLQVVTPLAHPRWFCRSPNAERAATLSEETDELIVVDVGTRPVRVPVGDGPVACAFIDEHTIALSHRHAPELWVMDLATTPTGIRKLALSGPLGSMTYDAAHAELVVSRRGVEPGLLHVAWPELRLHATSPLSIAADGLALCREALIITTRADASLRRLERQAERFVEQQRVELGRPAAMLAVDADAERVFVSVTDYRPAHSAAQLGNHFVQDQLLIFHARDLKLQQRILTARRSERQTKPGDADQGGSPLGLWPLHDGRVALTFAGSDELWRFRLPQAEPSSLRFDTADFYTPHGVVELHDGTLWLASPAAGSLAKLTPDSSKPVVIPLTPNDRSLASTRPAALARRIGERGFYESTRSGISCQSCHMHADSDLAAYNLGDHRLIPTLSVQGLFGTAPYLRDGSYPRLSDLDEVAQKLYRGYVRQQPGRGYAMQAYVESLPRSKPWPNAPRDEAAEQRGYTIFQRAGCNRCHKPPAFTNLGQLPLAALFPQLAATQTTKEQLDIPSLLSVATSPPYLHDGRAQTLQSVLTEHNPDNLHGNTKDLTRAEQNDLLHFLESL